MIQKSCGMTNSDQLSKQQFKTWFQYRGNKQFGPFFGAEFDPNGHKNHEKYLFLKSKYSYQKDTSNLLFW